MADNLFSTYSVLLVISFQFTYIIGEDFIYYNEQNDEIFKTRKKYIYNKQ